VYLLTLSAPCPATEEATGRGGQEQEEGVEEESVAAEAATGEGKEVEEESAAAEAATGEGKALAAGTEEG
jgi:hypothetical protein